MLGIKTHIGRDGLDIDFGNKRTPVSITAISALDALENIRRVVFFKHGGGCPWLVLTLPDRHISGLLPLERLRRCG